MDESTCWSETLLTHNNIVQCLQHAGVTRVYRAGSEASSLQLQVRSHIGITTQQKVVDERALWLACLQTLLRQAPVCRVESFRAHTSNIVKRGRNSARRSGVCLNVQLNFTSAEECEAAEDLFEELWVSSKNTAATTMSVATD